MTVTLTDLVIICQFYFKMLTVLFDLFSVDEKKLTTNLLIIVDANTYFTKI